MQNVWEPSTNAAENFENRRGPVHGMMNVGELRSARPNEPVSEHVAVTPVTPPDTDPFEAERQRSFRLEVLGQLTGAVAHDFNSLLTIIVGNLERLRDGSHDAFVQHGAKAALDAAVRGEKLVQSLLAFVRRRPLHHRVFDLNRTIRDMVPQRHGAWSQHGLRLRASVVRHRGNPQRAGQRDCGDYLPASQLGCPRRQRGSIHASLTRRGAERVAGRPLWGFFDSGPKAGHVAGGVAF